MLKSNGNGSGRYEEITGWEDIVAGADGNKKDAAEISEFLISWSEWLAEIIEQFKQIFKEIKYAIENNGK